ncbi:hypothetical protein N7462_001438 [Penicillium macrosclerotiorum]|uniref:uncharacterized protein n=1 Tax=Penicillium macrosclerotiorum TaxID=303699 RepID=UPI0025495BB6|nr:uncharacterized protein N7462_001438 [Penicillium macrosclerotiorum]KAJ5692015.1 hypothetical protein N7462_001438 [Penicillium macrosclerotiorum]
MAALGRGTSLASALLVTSSFTTVIPTTSVVTSSSAVAGCTVASSMQISCSNGYYNTYGAVWQETCAATWTGGSILSSGTGLSLRACASGCAVNSACTAAFYAPGNICYLLQGDVTLISGGPYQGVVRYAATASPCVSTWVVTETGSVTSTEEVVYTVTPTLTPTSTPISSPSAIVTPSSTPVAASTPSSTPLVASSSTPIIRSSTTASSSTSSPLSSSVRLSSTPLIPSSAIPSSAIPSSAIPSSAIPSSAIPSSAIPSSAIPSSAIPSSAIPSSPSSTSLSLGSSSSASSLSAASSTPLATATVTQSEFSPSTQSSDESSSSMSNAATYTSTYTITEAQVKTITSFAGTVTNCFMRQQTTYLTTETIIYVTTVCPEDSQATASQTTDSATTIPDTSAVQTTSASLAQHTDTGAPSSMITTSTIYITDIDVVTACPPSILNCPVGQKTTYATTRTVATYTTTYWVAVPDSTHASQSTSTSVKPLEVPTVSPTEPHIPDHEQTDEYTKYSDYTNRTLLHTPASNTWRSGIASSGSAKVATPTPAVNTPSGQTASSVTSAPSSVYTGGALKTGSISVLLTVLTVLSTLFFL